MSSPHSTPRPAGNGTARTAASVARAVGVLLLLPGVALTGLGAVGLWGAGNAAGEFVSSPTQLLETSTAALTSGPVELELDLESGWVPDGWEQARLQATSTTSEPVFIGVGPRADVEKWLAGVAHDQVRSHVLGTIRYDRIDGEQDTAAAPEEQTFWLASSSGTGLQEVDLGQETGEWVAVVAGTNGAPGVATQVSVAVRAPVVALTSGMVLAVGAPLLSGGLLLVVLGLTITLRRSPWNDGHPADGPTPGPTTATRALPAGTGRRGPDIARVQQ